MYGEAFILEQDGEGIALNRWSGGGEEYELGRTLAHYVIIPFFFLYFSALVFLFTSFFFSCRVRFGQYTYYVFLEPRSRRALCWTRRTRRVRRRCWYRYWMEYSIGMSHLGMRH